MVKQPVEIVYVNYIPDTRKIGFVKTSKNTVLSVDQVRKMIDDGIAVIVNDKNKGIVATVTKRDETGIQAVRDDSTENNLDSLEEFEL